MSKLRTTIAIALTAATFGLGALATNPASAHGGGHGGFRNGGYGHSHGYGYSDYYGYSGYSDDYCSWHRCESRFRFSGSR